MRRFLLLLISMTFVVLGLYGVRALLTEGPPSPSPGIDMQELDRRIEVFEARPDDPLNQSVLGVLYLHRAQAAGDIDDYVRARDVLLIATAQSDDPASLVSLAYANLALHEFPEAKTAADAALRRERSPGALAAAFDAEIALGDYTAAGSLARELLSLIPGDPAYLVRQGQLSYLSGDIDSAVEDADRAAEASVSIGQTASEQAFYLTAAGRLHFAHGNLSAAERSLRRALESDDTHPGALLELARVRAARGDVDEAIQLVETAVGRAPEPASLAFLGDLYTVVGQPESSRIQYATIGAFADLDNTAYRLPVAMAYASRGILAAEAVSLAEGELSVRSDPVTWHAYALALLRDGRVDDAHEAIEQALGPADASLWYHAALIAAAKGHSDEAIGHLENALELNPDFHPIDAVDARHLLEELAS